MHNDTAEIQEQLITGFQKGREKSFSQLFRELYPAMILYSFRYTKHQPVAEEIAEEAFIKAWDRRESFSHYKILCSWLYTTIRNASIEWLRHQHVEAKAEPVLSQIMDIPDPNALDHLIYAEVLRQLGDALNSLPRQQQKIVREFYLEGQSLQEIADQMRLSIHTVKSQKARGLKSIRKLLPLIYLFQFLRDS